MLTAKSNTSPARTVTSARIRAIASWPPSVIVTNVSEPAGSVTSAQIEEIAKTKMPDLNANDLDAAKKIIEGTARSMGLSVS